MTQVGNVDADVEMMADSDAMVCDGRGSIPAGNQRFQPFADTNVGYDDSTKTLTTEFQPIGLYDGSPSDGAIRRRTTDLAYDKAGHVAMNLAVPATGVSGNCTMTVSVMAAKHSVPGGGG